MRHASRTAGVRRGGGRVPRASSGGTLLRVCGALLAACAAQAAAATDAGAPVRFSREIRPLLADNCFHCHGPDPASRKAKLRLDLDEGFFGQRDDGPTVVKGKPEASTLYKRLVTADAADVMPPPKTHKVLSAEQKDLVRRWIAQGAQIDAHWSFVKPERREPPAPKAQGWARNAVDRFVLAGLEAAGLQPAPEADRRTLARRVALDLTGLPPTPEEVEAFVADGAADAYERMVDRLLASPRYGEHRARYWLDAARYADTHGMHFDNYREMWLYRDWVIAAFNRNLPFDRFTIEQIAGDLLPSATREQRIATGFHRCNITTNEGGTIAEENLAGYARDRVETTSWVWLGLTANCAVCHDHKFDPISQRDFYAMSAYFRNTTQGALDGNRKDTAPVVVVPGAADEARAQAIVGELDSARRRADERRAVLRAAFDAWLDKTDAAAVDAELDAGGAPALHLPLVDPGAADLAGRSGGEPVGIATAEPLGWVDGGRLGRAPRLGEKSALRVAVDAGGFERDKPASFGCWVRAPKDAKLTGAILARMDDGAEPQGWDLHARDSEFAVQLLGKGKDNGIVVRTAAKALRRDVWQHVLVTWDGSGKAQGLAIHVDGRPAKLAIERDALSGSIRTAAPFHVGRRAAQGVLRELQVQDVRLYERALGAQEVARIANAPRLRALLAKPAKDRDAKEKDEAFALASAGDAELAEASARVAALDAEQKAIRARSTVTHVMEEKQGSTPMAHVLFRGEYDKKRDQVEPGTFAALHPQPAGAAKNRLGLAQWLVAQDNPLTPRVIANRCWQEVFGVGLVRTAEDLGTMGEPPSHPELLDWLAVELRDGGWDMKKLYRLLVTSATYRQAAVATKEKIERDPQNRLLSRGPRFRMDAEMIRDYALAAAGILVPTMGGPSVKPYQPDGVWEAVGMRESDTKVYKRDGGDALRRRSVYSFWKRMAPPAALEILNAPSREVSCVRRERTNTPLQALVTLNDPQFVEAARMLAQLALQKAGDDAARIDLVARRILCRPLAPPETAIVAKIHQDLLARYRAAPDEAKRLIAVGELKADPAIDPAALAALTMVCNQLLNLDEALCK